MPSRNKFSQKLKIHGDENGYILGLVMVFFVVFSIIGLSFIKMAGHERIHASRDYHKEKAYYYARAGIHKGLWRINKISKAAGTFSDATVTVVYDSVKRVLKATGRAGFMQDSIRVTLQSIDTWKYLAFAGFNIPFPSGTGTITGDIHANNDVSIGGGYTVTGTSTETPVSVTAPTVDMQFFADAATAAGQYVVGNKDFVPSGSPYSGVWYVTGNARIKFSGVVINGSIVAGIDVLFQSTGDHHTVTATPANYPALVAGDDIRFEGHAITVSGFCYAADEVQLSGDSLSVTGALIGLRNVEERTEIGTPTDMVLSYDSTFTAEILGASLNPLGAQRILTWTEL